MSAVSARVAVVSGRNAIGIELPNPTREKVYLRELLTGENYNENAAKLPLCLGKTIGGESVVVDLSRMPHLLIAGATGSGKSVMVNALITSLLCNATPDDVRMILIDLKRIELAAYNGLPHLLVPVITEPERAKAALKWAVNEGFTYLPDIAVGGRVDRLDAGRDAEPREAIDLLLTEELRVLEAKGHVRHEEEGTKYVYFPVVPRRVVRKSALKHVMNTFFDGSAEKVVAALLGPDGGRLTEEELDRIADLVSKARAEESK